MRRVAEFAPLALLFALGVVLRYLWLDAEPMISHDGCLYVWQAQDILALGPVRGFVEGRGDYVLIASLYPYLIALCSPLTADPELTGKLISLACGLALPLAVALCVGAAGDRRLARWTAVLAFVHPAILPYTVRVQTEALYHLLLYFALAALAWAAAQGRAVHQVLAVVLFALAALTRHEGAFFLAASLLVIAWTARRRHGQAWRRVLPLVVVAAALLCPRVYLVHARTGVWALRTGVVAQLREKTYGYELDPTGRHLRHQHEMGDAAGPDGARRPPLHEGLIRRARYTAGNLLTDIFQALPAHLGLIALVLIGVGLARGPLAGPGRGLELLLGGFVLATVLGYAFYHHHPRYLVSALPALLCFAVHGLRNWPLGRSSRVLALAALLGPYLWLGVAPLRAPATRFPVHLMDAGNWIWKQQDPRGGSRPLVLSGERWSAYYAGGRQLMMPDADAHAIASYGFLHGATHWVLGDGPLDTRVRAEIDRIPGRPEPQVIARPSGTAWIYPLPRAMDAQGR